MSKRIVFVCYPDTNSPIGGVKQIYRQVELLARAGVDAYVLHRTAGFRATWFESTAPVIDLESYLASGPSAEHDLVVLPETWLSQVPSYLPGIPKAIFNQNAFYTFGLEGKCAADTLELYQHPDILGVVTVSHDSRRLLVEGCGVPSEHCHVVLNGIDPQLFYPPDLKVRRVVFMGRKHADHIRKALLMGSRRPRWGNYEFRELPRMSHRRVAEELRGALLFLSCGHPEGFGLPLAEAIASGCLVVGYHGLGGRDFAEPHMRCVEFGDLMGFVDSIEAELSRFEEHPAEVISERLRASKEILKMYSPEVELDACLQCWQQFQTQVN